MAGNPSVPAGSVRVTKRDCSQLCGSDSDRHRQLPKRSSSEADSRETPDVFTNLSCRTPA